MEFTTEDERIYFILGAGDMEQLACILHHNAQRLASAAQGGRNGNPATN